MYRISREGRRSSAHKNDPRSRPTRYKDSFDNESGRPVSGRGLPAVGAGPTGMHTRSHPGILLCLKATAALMAIYLVRGMHRSLCPGDAMPPELDKLHSQITSLNHRLELERAARKNAEDAMEDLRAQDRGRAGILASATGGHRAGVAAEVAAEAEAERAGIDDERADLHVSEALADINRGHEPDAGLSKGDIETLLREKEDTLEDIRLELESLTARNKELEDRVAELEDEVETRRQLALQKGLAVVGSVGSEQKAEELKLPSPKARHPFVKITRKDSGSNSKATTGHDSKIGGGGGGKRNFFVNPDDAYEGHPSNDPGKPFDSLHDWIIPEGEGGAEEDEEETEDEKEKGVGEGENFTLAGVILEPEVTTSDSHNHDAKRAPTPAAAPPGKATSDPELGHGLGAGLDLAASALDHLQKALDAGDFEEWRIEEGVDWANVNAENGSSNRPDFTSWRNVEKDEGVDEGGEEEEKVGGRVAGEREGPGLGGPDADRFSQYKKDSRRSNLTENRKPFHKTAPEKLSTEDGEVDAFPGGEEDRKGETEGEDEQAREGGEEDEAKEAEEQEQEQEQQEQEVVVVVVEGEEDEEEEEEVKEEEEEEEEEEEAKEVKEEEEVNEEEGQQQQQVEGVGEEQTTERGEGNPESLGSKPYGDAVNIRGAIPEDRAALGESDLPVGNEGSAGSTTGSTGDGVGISPPVAPKNLPGSPAQVAGIVEAGVSKVWESPGGRGGAAAAEDGREKQGPPLPREAPETVADVADEEGEKPLVEEDGQEVEEKAVQDTGGKPGRNSGREAPDKEEQQALRQQQQQAPRNEYSDGDDDGSDGGDDGSDGNGDDDGGDVDDSVSLGDTRAGASVVKVDKLRQEPLHLRGAGAFAGLKQREDEGAAKQQQGQEDDDYRAESSSVASEPQKKKPRNKEKGTAKRQQVQADIDYGAESSSGAPGRRSSGSEGYADDDEGGGFGGSSATQPSDDDTDDKTNDDEEWINEMSALKTISAAEMRRRDEEALEFMRQQ